jgi:hypothetical protein
LDLKKCFDGNVKFVELIPIKTKGTKDLNKVLDELKKKGGDKYNLDELDLEKIDLEVKNKFLGFLLKLLIEIKPELIICNCVKCSEIFDKKENNMSNETNVRYWNGIPVILSGQITGNRKPDKYTLRLIKNQVSDVIKKIKNCNLG